ncbi:MAG: YceH family protein [Trueperaceae bacterium]|nr:YceH family protein [Trueperaceae bacterium]
MALSDIELRVLGALMEKERTTPEGYPLSAQALLSACNQLTSRDPVTTYHLQDVLATVQRLQDKGLVAVVQTTGERVPKHRHRVAEALSVNASEAAVMAVLILRGPQTAGELRTRSERYQHFADPAAVENVLRRLEERQVPLVRNLGRGPGQSQDRWEHTLGFDEERLKPRVRARDDASSGAEPEARSAAEERVPVATSPTTTLAARVEELEATVEDLRRRLSDLESNLGIIE